jgi:transposase
MSAAISSSVPGRVPALGILDIPGLNEETGKGLEIFGWRDSDGLMIRGGFLSEEDRKTLIALARDGSSLCRVTRRANALVLLDDGMSCQQVARVLLFDDDTIRGWYDLFEQDGVEGLSRFDMGGSSSKMTAEQTEALKAWVAATLPRSTRQVGAWLKKEFGLVYESRSGLIALLHRLGLEYHKPEVISRKLDPETQKAFIASYEKLLNSLPDDEVVLFGDAVHPTHAARPVGCWAPKKQKLAIEQTSGRERINIHGAVDLETGQTRMIEADTVNAISTIQLLEALEALYPLMACIHLFLDNARYHHAKLVTEWLSRPGCRIKLHFLPAYCPHLNPIERLWGVMHKNITHNRCHDTCGQFAEATLHFLRDEVPRRWAEFRSYISDNFRVISPKEFRLLG